MIRVDFTAMLNAPGKTIMRDLLRFWTRDTVEAAWATQAQALPCQGTALGAALADWAIRRKTSVMPWSEAMNGQFAVGEIDDLRSYWTAALMTTRHREDLHEILYFLRYVLPFLVVAPLDVVIQEEGVPSYLIQVAPNGFTLVKAPPPDWGLGPFD